MLLVDSPAAQLLGSSRTGPGVKYKTVVRWQMGLFSVWHSGRIISQILVPVDVECEYSQPSGGIILTVWM